MENIILMLALIIALLIPSITLATIPLIDGVWSTTFDCTDWVWPNAGTCDGLDLSGGGESSGWAGSHTSITADANYPGGLGGKGIRYWVNDGEDALSAGIYARLPQQEKEFWIRAYFRYETGFTWEASNSNNPVYNKLFYIRCFSFNNQPSAIPNFAGERITINPVPGVTEPDEFVNTAGWPSVYPTGTSDGSWFCYEFHVKMNTTALSEDGVGQIWRNGVLVANEEALNWDAGIAGALDGYVEFLFRSNQANPENGGEMHIDYDDLVIVTSSTSTTLKDDGSGNLFIGPLDLTPPASSGTTQNGFGGGKWGR